MPPKRTATIPTAPEFPPPKTLDEFQKAIIVTEDWIRELEASKALAIADRTKTAKNKRAGKTQIINSIALSIEEGNARLEGLRQGLASVGVGEDSPKRDMVPQNTASLLTHFGEEDAQGEPDPSYTQPALAREVPGSTGSVKDNTPDPSLSNLGNKGEGHEGTQSPDQTLDHEGLEDLKKGEEEKLDATVAETNWDLYTEIAMLVDEDRAASSLSAEGLTAYLNCILLSIENDFEVADDNIDKDPRLVEILEGNKNVLSVWGWRLYLKVRKVVDKYQEMGRLAHVKRTDLLRRLGKSIWTNQDHDPEDGLLKMRDMGDEGEEDEEDVDEEEDEEEEEEDRRTGRPKATTRIGSLTREEVIKQRYGESFAFYPLPPTNRSL
ncbi:hypothetical protein CC2G_008436 [Coprinopsis cinerea AmutBmut pab1-1]|nr:hypothetical protein CC2G_008436 [Coprinopsis cinerea AmutBmut pab1-1]